MKTLLYIYAGLTALLMLDCLLYLQYDISFTGHRTDWLLFWIWLIATPIVVIVNFRRRWARAYIIMLAIFTVLSMVPMGVPFLTVLVFAMEVHDQRYRVNDSIDVQENSKSVIAMPSIVAIKSFGVFERVIGKTDSEFEVNGAFRELEDAESIKQINDPDSSELMLEFKFKDGVAVRTLRK
jgi:hypothetical protein